MPAAPAWYSDAEVLLTGAQTLSGQQGTPSASLSVRLWNDKGGTLAADALEDAYLKPLFLAADEEWDRRRYVEARVESGLGGLTVLTGPWTPVGLGALLPLPTLASNRGVRVQFRLNVPLDTPDDTASFDIRLVTTTGEYVADGLTLRSADGVCLGLFDREATGLLYRSADVVEDTPASADVDTPEVVYISQGKAWTIRAGEQTPALAAGGKERYDLLSLSASGAWVLTAGVEKTIGTLTPADKPATPANHVAFAYITRDDAGNLLNANIENVWQHWAFGVRAGTGLNAEVGGGWAVVDNGVVRIASEKMVGLTASSTNSIWLLQNGDRQKTTDGNPPSTAPRALLLAEVDTDGSGVTAVRDKRRFVGHQRAYLTFDWWGTLNTTDWRYVAVHTQRPAQIVPVHGLVLALGGAAPAGGGQNRVEIEVEYTAGVWTDLHATAADRPTIASGATDLVDGAKNADRWDLPGETRVRAKFSELTGTAPTEGAQLSIEVAY